MTGGDFEKLEKLREQQLRQSRFLPSHVSAKSNMPTHRSVRETTSGLSSKENVESSIKPTPRSDSVRTTTER